MYHDSYLYMYMWYLYNTLISPKKVMFMYLWFNKNLWIANPFTDMRFYKKQWGSLYCNPMISALVECGAEDLSFEEDWLQFSWIDSDSPYRFLLIPVFRTRIDSIYKQKNNFFFNIKFYFYNKMNYHTLYVHI